MEHHQVISGEMEDIKDISEASIIHFVKNFSLLFWSWTEILFSNSNLKPPLSCWTLRGLRPLFGTKLLGVVMQVMFDLSMSC